MKVLAYVQITLTKGQVCVRQSSSGGRGAQGGGDIVHAPVPGRVVGRRWVGGCGAVGGRARAGAGARTAVVRQRREQRVLLETFALELQLQVLADLLREAPILPLQFPLQLRLKLEEDKQEVSSELPSKETICKKKKNRIMLTVEIFHISSIFC